MNMQRRLIETDQKLHDAIDNRAFDRAMIHCDEAESLAKHIMYGADEPPNLNACLFVEMNNAMWYYRELKDKIKAWQKRQRKGAR